MASILSITSAAYCPWVGTWNNFVCNW